MLFLARRDRWACVFCGKPTEIETVTVEHFVLITAGGNSHLANLSLAHEECNAAASHLSVREKVEMAVRIRCTPARNAERPPAGAACLDSASSVPEGDVGAAYATDRAAPSCASS